MIVKRFLCFLAAVFVLVAGCSVPVLAEGESSVPDADIRPVPDFPELADDYTNHVIIYYSYIDKFFLFCSNTLPDPVSYYQDDSVLCQLRWEYPRDLNVHPDVVSFSLDGNSGIDWVLDDAVPCKTEGDYALSHSGDTYYRVFFGLSGFNYGSVDSSKGYVVYSDFSIIAGSYSFFPTPSPVARTTTYLSLHTDLWQTIAAGVEKVLPIGIAVLSLIILYLLFKRLIRLLTHGGTH